MLSYINNNREKQRKNLENTMIDALLAKKFIERITQYTEYNVNIMDEKGDYYRQ